jgi:hypothetical protein
MVHDPTMARCLRAISSTLLSYESGATYALDERHREACRVERAPEAAALAGQAGQQIGDDGRPQSGSQPRGVYEVDEEAALAELEKAWADGGHHGFCGLEHSLWSAIGSAGEVLTRAILARRASATS